MRLAAVFNRGLIVLLVATLGGAALLAFEVRQTLWAIDTWALAQRVGDAQANAYAKLYAERLQRADAAPARAGETAREARDAVAAVRAAAEAYGDVADQPRLSDPLIVSTRAAQAADDAYRRANAELAGSLGRAAAAAEEVVAKQRQRVAIVNSAFAAAEADWSALARAQTDAHALSRIADDIVIDVGRLRLAAGSLVATGDAAAQAQVEALSDGVQAHLARLSGARSRFSDRARLLTRWADAHARQLPRAVAGNAAAQAARARAAARLQTEAQTLRDAVVDAEATAMAAVRAKRTLMTDLAARRDMLRTLTAPLEVARVVISALDGASPRQVLLAADVVDGNLAESERLIAMAQYVGAAEDAAAFMGPFRRHSGEWAVATAHAHELVARADALAEAAAQTAASVANAADATRAAATASIDRLAASLAVAATAASIVAPLLAWLLWTQLTAPLARITATIRRLAKGELETPVAVAGRADEFVELAAAAEALREASLQRLRLEREALEAQRRLAEERAEAEKTELRLRAEQERARAQRLVVSVVSHEFRTPLAIIDGNVGAVMRRFDRLGRDQVMNKLARARSGVERLISLIETFLFNAKIDADAVRLDLAPFDLAALIAEVCENQGDIAPSHAIALHVGPDVDVSAWRGDARLLRQVAVNLLSNAVKYSPDADRVEVSLTRTGARLDLAVRDFGVGIPEDELPRISQQFFRASTSNGILGTGIGLNIVRTFVAMHGGEMAITSRVGEGSTFTASLPLGGAPDPHAAPDAEAAVASDGNAQPSRDAGPADAPDGETSRPLSRCAEA